MNKARRAALAKALPLVERAQRILAEASAIVDTVQGDEEEALSNMSDGQRDGDQGQAMQAAIDDMSEAASAIASIDLKAVADHITQAADEGHDVQPARMSEAEAMARREARLPKWAKDRIAAADKARGRAEAELARAFTDPDPDKPAQITVDDYVSPLKGKVVPAKMVTFPSLGIRVHYDEQRKALSVNAVSIGTLAITPQAANGILIRTERF